MINKLFENTGIKLWFSLSISIFIIFRGINTYNLRALAIIFLGAFIIAFYITYKLKILNILFRIKSKQYAIISFPIAIYLAVKIALTFWHRGREIVLNSNNPIALEIRTLSFEKFILSAGFFFSIMAGVIVAFILYAIVYAILSQGLSAIISFVKSTDRIERWYIIVGFVTFTIFITVIYNITEVTYTTQGYFNIIFTTDSSAYIRSDLFLNLDAPANDGRQPLFSLATIPFAFVAKILAIPFFFFSNAYILIIQVMQVGALLVMTVFMLRMTKIEDRFSKIAFLVLYSFSYSFLLFSLVIEQYIASTFLLILTIYMCIYKNRKSPALTALSVGTLLTNVAIIPFITFEEKSIDWLRQIVKAIIAFVALCAFFGKISFIIKNIYKDIFLAVRAFADAESGITSYKAFQFTHFIESCFFSPKIKIIEEGFASFQLLTPTNLSFLGIALLICTILSIVINKKLPFVQICGFWVFFSVVLLLVIGWGSPENGMILYSLYFSWAFFVLVFLLIEKLLEKYKPIKYTAYAIAILITLIVNANGIIGLVKFGIEYYPVK